MKKTLKNRSLSIIAGVLFAVSGGYALPTEAEPEPSVQLGVVAQRYPWNGTLDVGYRASGLPAAGTNAVLTVTVSDDRVFTQEVTLANGTNTLTFTEIPANVKAKDAKVTLKVK